MLLPRPAGCQALSWRPAICGRASPWLAPLKLRRGVKRGGGRAFQGPLASAKRTSSDAVQIMPACKRGAAPGRRPAPGRQEHPRFKAGPGLRREHTELCQNGALARTGLLRKVGEGGGSGQSCLCPAMMRSPRVERGMGARPLASLSPGGLALQLATGSRTSIADPSTPTEPRHQGRDGAARAHAMARTPR